MTREEAIMMLVRIKDRINYEVTDAQKKMDALNMAIKALEKQSEGHWIVRVFPEEHPFLAERHYCSVCGDWQTHGALKYCPNCGARMSGEVETE